MSDAMLDFAMRAVSPSWVALRFLMRALGLTISAQDHDRRDFVPCEVTARVVDGSEGMSTITVDIAPEPPSVAEDEDGEDCAASSSGRRFCCCMGALSALRALVVMACICEQPAQTVVRIVRWGGDAVERERMVAALCFQLVPPLQFALLMQIVRAPSFAEMHGPIMEHYCACAASSAPVTTALFVLLCGGAGAATAACWSLSAGGEWWVEARGVGSPVVVGLRGAQWALSYLVLSLTAVVYGIVFCAHAVRLRRCSAKLVSDAPDPVRRPALAEVCHQVTGLRHEIESAVRDFGNIIAVPTILAAVGAGVVFDVARQGETDPFSLVAIATFFAMQVFFMLSTSKLGTARQDLFGITFDPEFSAAYVATAGGDGEDADHPESVLSDMDHLLSRVNEANTLAQWAILQRVLGEHWLDLTVFGVSLLDGSLVKQGIAMGALFLACLRWAQ